jgi:hypothetical protein
VASASLPLAAQDLASGSEISGAISGNTVQGSMSAAGAYSEFYAADGTIRATGYTGTWAVVNDTMCFKYGDAAPDCWNVAIEGSDVTWVQNGAEGGGGTITPGNPNNY